MGVICYEYKIFVKLHWFDHMHWLYATCMCQRQHMQIADTADG